MRNHEEYQALSPTHYSGDDRYDVIVSGRKLVLWMDTKSKKPVRVSLEMGMGTQTIEYLAYEDNLEYDPSLFRAPDGIAIENAK